RGVTGLSITVQGSRHGAPPPGPPGLRAAPHGMSPDAHFSQGWARFGIPFRPLPSQQLTKFVPTGDRNQNRPGPRTSASRQLGPPGPAGRVGRFTPRHGGATWWRVVAARSRVPDRPTTFALHVAVRAPRAAVPPSRR